MRTIKGFTLIEMIIVMTITAIVVAVSATVLKSAFTNYFTGVNVSSLSNQASNAMTRMSEELQQAGTITTSNASNVTFTTIGGSTISYSYSSPTLTRTGSGTSTLANQVTSFSLSYYQANFSSTSTPSLVRAVTISMTLSNGNESLPLINTIFLNNI